MEILTLGWSVTMVGDFHALLYVRLLWLKPLWQLLGCERERTLGIFVSRSGLVLICWLLCRWGAPCGLITSGQNRGATGWPISSKKTCFLAAKKGVFGLKMLFLHSNGQKWVKMIKSGQKHPFWPPKNTFFFYEIGHPVAKRAGEDIKKLYFGSRPSPRTWVARGSPTL